MDNFLTFPERYSFTSLSQLYSLKRKDTPQSLNNLCLGLQSIKFYNSRISVNPRNTDCTRGSEFPHKQQNLLSLSNPSSSDKLPWPHENRNAIQELTWLAQLLAAQLYRKGRLFMHRLPTPFTHLQFTGKKVSTMTSKILNVIQWNREEKKKTKQPTHNTFFS